MKTLNLVLRDREYLNEYFNNSTAAVVLFLGASIGVPRVEEVHLFN